jgi:hypothetical protein
LLLLELIMQVAGLWLAILILACCFFFFFPWGCTFWAGGIFSLRMIFGEHYPEKPPRVRFTTDVFHPNGELLLMTNCWVSLLSCCDAKKRILDPCELFWVIHLYAVYSDGTLCMDVLQDNWSPCQNVSTILTSIQVLGLTLPLKNKKIYFFFCLIPPFSSIGWCMVFEFGPFWQYQLKLGFYWRAAS